MFQGECGLWRGGACHCARVQSCSGSDESGVRMGTSLWGAMEDIGKWQGPYPTCGLGHGPSGCKEGDILGWECQQVDG